MYVLRVRDRRSFTVQYLYLFSLILFCYYSLLGTLVYVRDSNALE